MTLQPIMLTLVARAFDAVAPLPQTGAPEGVVTLITLAGDETGFLWGVRETVEDIANLVDARRS